MWVEEGQKEENVIDLWVKLFLFMITVNRVGYWTWEVKAIQHRRDERKEIEEDKKFESYDDSI